MTLSPLPTLHGPGDPAYEDCCGIYNAMVTRRPQAVVRCASPEDVAAALTYARDHGLEIAVRAGGHSVAGLCLVDDGIVLDVRPMDAVEVDAERRIARIGGGAVWSQVDAATAEHGLAVTGGRVSTTGVVGLTLGGGTGWLERLHGLTCDNLVAAELVLADGSRIRADDEQHTELLWAMRGGGANFGVVTAIELRLHEQAPEVLGGIIIHPYDRFEAVFAYVRDVMRDAPDALNLGFVAFTCPDEDPFPVEHRGKLVTGIVGLHAGPVEEAERVLAPIRAWGDPAADLFAVQPYVDVQCQFDDPPGYRNYWTAENVHDLPAEAIARLYEHTKQQPLGASQLFVPFWGGAVARATPEHSPLRGRDTLCVVHPLVLWEDPADDERNMAFGGAYRDLVKEWSVGAAYPNFLGEEGTARARSAFGDSYERLVAIKDEYDPDHVFRGSGTQQLVAS